MACCSSSGKWIMEMAIILRAEEEEGRGGDGEIKIKNKWGECGGCGTGTAGWGWRSVKVPMRVVEGGRG